MARRLQRSLLLIFVFVAASAFNCRFAPNPTQGTRTINVPHVTQSKDWYCGPATVLMWARYVHGTQSTVTQDSIWNWMVQNFPGQANAWWPGGGATNFAIAGAASHYTNRTIVVDQYNGTNEVRQAVADQQKSIEAGHPTIVAVNAVHLVAVKGTTWHELSDAIGRPNSEYMTVQDPLRSPNQAISIGQWLNQDIILPCSTPPCSQNIQVLGRQTLGQQALVEFDYFGGTYYGPTPSSPTGRYKLNGFGQCYWEPNDSGPNQCTMATGRYKWSGSECYWDPNDSGPNQCSPQGRKALPELLAWLFGRSPVRLGIGQVALQSPMKSERQVTRPRRAEEPKASLDNNNVPFPNTRRRHEILANIAAGVRHSHLDDVLGIPELAQADIDLRIRRLLTVYSIPRNDEYYVVELANLAGAPVANIAISLGGVIMTAEDVRGLHLPRALELSEAMARVSRRRGKQPANARYVWDRNVAEPGSSVLVPLVSVHTDIGAIYFNSYGEAFAEEGSTADIESALSGRAPLKIPPGVMRLRSLGVW